MDLWDKFEHSGKVEDYLSYKYQSFNNIYTYDILKNGASNGGTDQDAGAGSAGTAIWG